MSKNKLLKQRASQENQVANPINDSIFQALEYTNKETSKVANASPTKTFDSIVLNHDPLKISTEPRSKQNRKKNIISLGVNDELLKKIEDYKFDNRLKNTTEALVTIIESYLNQSNNPL